MAPQEVDPFGEADRLAFFDTVDEGFARASAEVGIRSRDFSMAGRRLRLQFAGDALVPAILPAIAHRETEVSGRPDFTIDLFDAHSTGTPLPFLAARFVDLLRVRWWEHLQGRCEVDGLNGRRIRTVFHLGPDILALWDAERRRGLYWVEKAGSIPYYEKGYPLSVLLNWWLGSEGCSIVHAACVGREHGAVLLTARGGSGKSTTALNCVRSGLKIVGDDYTAVDLSSGTAHSLYNTIKLKSQEDVERFPGLAERVSNLDRVGEGPDQEKAMVFLHRHFPEDLADAIPVRAILVPRIVDRVETTIVPLPAATAFKALAPSTVFQLPGNGHEAFSALARITRTWPAFEIRLGSDYSSIPLVIDDLLAAT